MNMNLRVFLFLCLWLYPNVYAVDYIRRQDEQRQSNFSIYRNEMTVQHHTHNISQRLTDSRRINYGLKITPAQREIIYKAIIGGVLVHDRVVYTPNSSSNPRYKAHCQAVQTINQVIETLWDHVKEGNYIVDLNQITVAPTDRRLLNTNLLKWFYEVLGAYRQERNFFDGRANFDWFTKVKKIVEGKEGRLLSHVKGDNGRILHEHIMDSKGSTLGILKLRPQERENKRNDWLLFLCAKSVGLNDVVNAIIPVRVRGVGQRSLTIDPRSFTHTLEPFVGINESDINGSPLAQLLSNTYRRSEEKGERQEVTNFMPTLRSFAHYFEYNRLPALERKRGKSPSVQGVPDSVPFQVLFRDLKAFKGAIRLENLLKLIAFWQLFKIKNMDDAHLLWVSDPQDRSKFSIVCVGAESFVGHKPGTYLIDIPPLSMLRQATEVISPQDRRFLERISSGALFQVLDFYLGASQIDASERREIGVAVDSVQQAFREGKTLRNVMHTFYLGREQNFVFGSLSYKKRSEFYSEVDHKLTVFHPLEIRPCGKPAEGVVRAYPIVQAIPGYKEIYVEGIYGSGTYLSYQVRYLYDWVFSVKSLEDLQKGRFFPATACDADDRLEVIENMWKGGSFPSGMIPFIKFFGEYYEYCSKVLPPS